MHKSRDGRKSYREAASGHLAIDRRDSLMGSAETLIQKCCPGSERPLGRQNYIVSFVLIQAGVYCGTGRGRQRQQPCPNKLIHVAALQLVLADLHLYFLKLVSPIFAKAPCVFSRFAQFVVGHLTWFECQHGIGSHFASHGATDNFDLNAERQGVLGPDFPRRLSIP